MPTTAPLLVALATLFPAAASAVEGRPLAPSGSGTDQTSTPAKPVISAGWAEADRAAAIPEPILDAVRAKAVFIAHPPGQDPLVRGLEELAKAEPRYALRTALAPSADWYAKGGVGHGQVGAKSQPGARWDGLEKRFEQQRLGKTVAVAQVGLSPSDFPDHQRAEVVWTEYRLTMNIEVTSATVTGSFTETLLAPRVITTPTGTAFSAPVPYPLELPNVGVTHLSTVLGGIPAGGHPGGDPGMKMVAALSPRDPRVAFKAHTERLPAFEKTHASTTLVHATVPLKASGNWQRNAYNADLRNWTAATGRPLFDAADILARGPDGVLAQDAERDRLAPGWIDTSGQPNAAARARLAKAWWTLQARLAGWDG